MDEEKSEKMRFPTMEEIQYTFYAVGVLSSIVGLALLLSNSFKKKQKKYYYKRKNNRK
jgi:hypothetical protein